MADVELVIKIPEKEYQRWQKDGEMDALIVRNAIVNGTPLPKGHGRLIDADELVKEADEFELVDDVYMLIYEEDIYNAPTIIEADRS